MPLYQIKGPDGKTYQIEGPEGATRDEVIDAILARMDSTSEEVAPAPEPIPEPGATGLSAIGPSIARGFKQTGMLLGDVLPGMVGKAVGAEDYYKRQMEEAAQTQKEIEQKYRPAVGSFTNIEGAGDVLTYIVEAVGEAVPTMLPAIFTGGAAAFLGRGGVEAAKQAAATAVRNELGKKAIGEKGLEGLNAAAIKEIQDKALDAGVKAAQRKALMNQTAGAFAGSAALNIPEVYQNILETTGKEELGAAVVAGGFNAVLDSILPVTLLSKLQKTGLSPKEVTGAWYKRAAKGGAKGFFTEGATEAVQEMSSAAAEAFVDENQKFFSPENFVRFIDAGLKGGLGGGAITGAADVITGRRTDGRQVDEVEDRSFFDTGEDVTDTTEQEAPPADTTEQDDKEIIVKPNKYENLYSPEDSVQSIDAAPTTPITGEQDATAAVTPPAEGVGATPTGEGAAVPVEPGDGVPAGAGVAEADVGGVGVTGEAVATPDGREAGAPATVAELDDVPDAFKTEPPTPVAETTTPERAKPTLSAAPSTIDETLDLLNSLKVQPKDDSTLAITEDQREMFFGALQKVGLSPEAYVAEDGSLDIDGATADIQRAKAGAMNLPLSEYSDEELEAEAKRVKARRYKLSEEQREQYEKTKDEFNALIDAEEDPLLKDYKFPEFRKLDPAEKLVYFGENISLNTPEEHQRAAERLNDYRTNFLSFARDERRAAKAQGREAPTDAELHKKYGKPLAYETNRPAFMPPWSQLSDESRQIWLDTVQYGSPVEQELALRKMAPIEGQNIEERRRTSAAISEQRRQEAVAGGRDVSYGTALQKTRDDTKGKGIVDLLKDRNKSGREKLKALLNYLKSNAAGARMSKAQMRSMPATVKLFGAQRQEISAAVYRTLAGTLLSMSDQTSAVNFVYESKYSKTSPTRPATYEPRTNTIYFNDRGLSETALLHELVHAYTVKILQQYFKNPTLLNPEVRAAVGQIINVQKLAEQQLGREFPRAFDNTYEFVSYALTDPDFQRRLSEIQIKDEQKIFYTAKDAPSAQNAATREADLRGYDAIVENLWDVFTGALAWIYKIFTPGKLIEKYFLPSKDSKPLKPGELVFEGRGSKKELTENDVQDLISQGDWDTFVSIREAELEAQAAEPTLIEQPSVEEQIAGLRERGAKQYRQQTEQELATGYTNTVPILVETPGYRGNAFLEVAAAFQYVLSSPEALPEFTLDTGAETLPVTVPAGARAPETTFDDAVKGSPGINPNYVGNRIKNFFSMRGAREATTKFVNERHIVKVLQGTIERAGKAIYAGAKKNAIYDQITLSMSRGRFLYETRLEGTVEQLHKNMKALADKLDITVDEAFKTMDMIMKTLHERERRHVKYLFYVPLTQQGFNDRAKIINDLRNGKINPANAAKAMQDLESIVAKNKDAAGFTWGDDPTASILATDSAARYNSTDENDSAYNVLAKFDADEWQKFYKTAKKYEQMPEVDAVIKNLKTLNRETLGLDRMSNYYSNQVEAVVNFYGFNYYVPLKGIVDNEQNRQFDVRRSAAREVLDAQNSFEGRVSDSNNALVQTMIDATKAAARAGRSLEVAPEPGQDVPVSERGNGLSLAIKNAVNQKLIKGDAKQKITFAERYKGGTKLSDLKGKSNVVLHYEANGDITIIRIEDQELLNGIRKVYQTTNPIVNVLNTATSFFGQMHTRYNIAFGPANFLIDGITNALNIAAQGGLGLAPRYMKQLIGNAVLHGGLYKAGKFSALYAAGKFDTINSLAKKDAFYADMLEYVRLGGRTAYVRGLTAEGVNELARDAQDRNPIVLTKKNIDKVVDVWTDAFELASRTAGYRVYKAQFRAQDPSLSEEALRSRAAAATKNLANFEQVGRYGQAVGAAFMFFRPAATGAQRAFESIYPALIGFDRYVETLPLSAQRNLIKYDKNGNKVKLPGYEKAKEKHEENARNARAVLAATFGLGAAVYAMAAVIGDDDDLGRDKVLTDDMARWTRYARFHFSVGDRDFVFQLPWGFGLGAVASAGAQIAGYGHAKALRPEGDRSFLDMMGHLIEVGMDSFLPLPVSRINPFERPVQWMIDTITPSIGRPLVEYGMNTDALGRQIYNKYSSRVSEAFTGGDNIPELYKNAAKFAFDNLGWEVSPNVLYFFANNYADGLARLMHNGLNIVETAAGSKEFNPRTDTLLFDRFFGAVSNVDSREFRNVDVQIREIADKLRVLKNYPDRYDKYLSENPFHEYLVQSYNKEVNGYLRDVREEMNKIRRMEGITPKTRDRELRMLKLTESIIKRDLIEKFKAYGITQ